jgi:putative ubiquitin-RnfH superfamily antitoxin RatB of RatAB toxin-antitoxin module
VKIEVEIVYARPEEQGAIRLTLVDGSTVGDALAAARIDERWPELGEGYAGLGIYGRIVTPDTRLRAGDRIEIYRPLVADPKQARRARAGRKP